MDMHENSKPKTAPKQPIKDEGESRDGSAANDPNREDPMHGGHQGSTGQRDKHDR
jgi:hypothetical protein